MVDYGFSLDIDKLFDKDIQELRMDLQEALHDINYKIPERSKKLLTKYKRNDQETQSPDQKAP